MEWTFEDLGDNLKNLNPKVSRKALEIANQLMKEGDYNKGEAIKQGVKEAQEWFFDKQG